MLDEQLTDLLGSLVLAVKHPGRKVIVPALVRAADGLDLLAHPDGRVLASSAGWEPLVGYTTEQIAAIGWRALIHPDDADSTDGVVVGMQDETPAFRFENRWVAADGSDIPLRWDATVFLPMGEDEVTLAVAEVREAE